MAEKYFVFILFFLNVHLSPDKHRSTSNVNAFLVDMTISFKEVKHTPGDDYIVETFRNLVNIGECLLKCSNNDQCRTVAHEDDTCSIYNATEGIREKRSGEKVVTMMTREEITGMDYSIISSLLVR